MPPRSFLPYGSHGAAIKAKVRRYLSAAAGVATNLSDLFYRQFAQVAFHTPRGAVSPFCFHVGIVVLKRADEQVRRVYAQAVVAVVQRVAALRYFAVCQFPREAMRPVPDFLKAEASIAAAVHAAHPQPATGGFANKYPKLLYAVSFHKGPILT